MRLVLLRHAKSAWPYMPDRKRPLAPRGRRDAPVVGRWLRRAGYLPDLVLCSTAHRARETWQLAQAEMGPAAPVTFDDGAYQASAAGLLELIRRTPPEAATLLVIGHDPTIPQLALLLAWQATAASGPASQAGRPDALTRMQWKFPAAAVAVLDDTATAWTQLGPGQAALLKFMTPRDISRASPGGG